MRFSYFALVWLCPVHAQQIYSFNTLDFGTRRTWMVNAIPWSFYLLEIEPVPFVQEVWWVSGSVWKSPENLAPTGIWNPKLTVLSNSRLFSATKFYSFAWYYLFMVVADNLCLRVGRTRKCLSAFDSLFLCVVYIYINNATFNAFFICTTVDCSSPSCFT